MTTRAVESFRLSAETKRQLSELAERMGTSRAGVVTFAVDRTHREGKTVDFAKHIQLIERTPQMIERFEQAYTKLVDMTENIAILRNRLANERLSTLLTFCEYLQGAEDDDPLDEWFGNVTSF